MHSTRLHTTSRPQEVGTHQEVDVGGVAEALTSAGKVIIVPGYGMAVANAQYPVAALAKQLAEKGVQVRHGTACDVQAS